MSSSDEDDYMNEEADLSDDELVARFHAGKLNSQTGLGAAPAHHRRPEREKNTNDEAALKEVCESISISTALAWPQTFLIGGPVNEIADGENEFQREDSFVAQTLLGLDSALKLLQQHQVSIVRPDDYFAEMVKTDDHMLKVRHNVSEKKQQMEASEKAKKLRELRKFGKKVQVETQQKRMKEKKASIDRATRARKGIKGHLDAGVDDFGVEAESGKAATGSNFKKGLQPGHTKPLANMKRRAKDAKYGSGGKQATKKFKRNDTESASDISRTYSARKNKAPFAGSGKAGFSGGAKKKSGGSGGGGSKNKRPGKARRQSGKK